MRRTIDKTQKAFLNNSKITIIEYSDFDEKNRVWLHSKTWIDGWYKRESTLLTKLTDMLDERQRLADGQEV